MDRLGDEKSGIFICEGEGKGRQVFGQGNELFISCPCRVKENIITESS